MQTEMTPHEASSTLSKGEGVLIDVRTPAEFREVHAEHAVNIPLDTLDREAVGQVAAGRKALFICKSGARGRQALERATEWGLPCVNVAGGTTAWEASGESVVRGERSVISLERQVRIGAGTLVAVGTALGLLTSPWFFAVPLFVGCGLVFAGVTDTCGMAMLFAKMPWNK